MQRLLPVRPLRMRTDISAFRWKISRDQWKLSSRLAKWEKNEIRTLLFSSTGISRLLRVHTVTKSCTRSGATLPTGNRKLKNSTLYIWIPSAGWTDFIFWTKLKSKVSGAVKVRIWRLKLMSKVLMPTMIYARLSISFAIMAKLSPLSRK